MLLHQRGAGYGYFRNNPSSDARIAAGFRDPRPTDLSVVVDMSGRLPDPPISPGDKVQRPSAADSHPGPIGPRPISQYLYGGALGDDPRRRP